MHITDKASAPYFDTGYGEHIYELAGPNLGNMSQHSIAYVEIEPGKASKKHYHPQVEETYYIISGQAKIILNDQESVLNPGELVAIEPNTHHKIINTSSDTPLRFIATCATPWTEDCTVFVE